MVLVRYVMAADGVAVAVEDLGEDLGEDASASPGGLGREVPHVRPGGTRDPAAVVMAHATGLCRQVMAPLGRHLQPAYRCLTLDERGHGDSGVPAEEDFDWHGFAADVLAVVDGLDLLRPLGVGHSCGGAALLLAEEARPGTFAALYCYEPVVFPTEPSPGPDPGNPLSAAALRRRDVFESREEAYANFASKAPLDVLDPEVLRAYVEHGFVDLPGGRVALRCRPEHEARIYANGFSHDAYPRLGRVACPVTLAWGGQSRALGRRLMEPVAARLPRARTEELAGLGHFGPLEDPARVAASVLAAFADSSTTDRAGMVHLADTPPA